jgi:hypothetical protein
MNETYNYGEIYNVSGQGNVGKGNIYNNQSGADANEAWRDMINAIMEMRGQIGSEDRQVVDTALMTIKQGDKVEKSTMRRALGDVAGVASLVGTVGVPVIQAVRAVLSAIGIG